MNNFIILEICDTNWKLVHTIETPAVSFLGIFLLFATKETNYNLRIKWPNNKCFEFRNSDKDKIINVLNSL